MNPLQNSLGLKGILALLLLAGLFFRFTNLDVKVYQHDEVMTSLRVAGTQAQEIRKEVLAKGEVGIRELQNYLRLGPETTLYGTWRALAGDDPKHPPLYYSLAWMWVQVFGDSVSAIRSLSAVISLLTLGCFYWLSRELFASVTIAWMSVILIALSPFHVLYAQEARQYSLWALVTVFSSVALLRALRVQTWRSWGVYGAAVAAGLHTHILFLLVVFAHCLYVVGLWWWQPSTIKKYGFPQEVVAYGVATFGAFLLFTPWALLIVFQLPMLHDNTRWITREFGWLYHVKHWALGMSTLFFDPSGGTVLSARASRESFMTYWIRLPVLLLIGYACFYLYRRTPQRVWFFVLSLIGGTIFPLILTDLVTGWRSSTPFRYLTPGYMGMQLAVAYLLATEISAPSSLRQKGWQVVTILLITAAIASCARNLRAEVWWNKEASYGLPSTTVVDRKMRYSRDHTEGRS